MRRCSEPSRAFTLLEALVTVAVLSVLLAITLPVLRGARSRGEGAQCQAKVGQIMQGFALASNQNGGYWPNAFERGSSASSTTVYHPGESTSYGIAYFDQTIVWTGGLIGAIWEQGDAGTVFACPSAARLLAGADVVPQAYGLRSYMYSAALVSTPDLWEDSAAG